MLTILSPSKTLNFDDTLSSTESTTPELLSEAKQIHKAIKSYSPNKLEQLMKISPKLAHLNFERFQKFSSKADARGSRCALLAYRGDVYEGFSLEDYSSTDFQSAQKRLRILSGLYGILKPLDLIQPYRLEMKTPLPVGSKKDLYTFWHMKITDLLNQHLKAGRSKTLVNLASQEYSKAIDLSAIDAHVITIDFKERKGGQLKTVGLFAKKARGKMANHITLHRLNSPEPLKKYTEDGYRFSDEHSDKDRYVFIR